MNHDSSETPLDGHSKLCFARDCPRAKAAPRRNPRLSQEPLFTKWWFLPCSSPSRIGRQLRAQLQSKITGPVQTCTFNATIQIPTPRNVVDKTWSDGTMVSFTLTNYDDAHPGITTTAPLRQLLYSNNFGWDVRVSGQYLALGRELCLA